MELTKGSEKMHVYTDTKGHILNEPILCILTIPLAFLFKIPKGGIEKVTMTE